ncbi:ATP-dependent RNA helicase vasa-like [Choristoneura fumiferana]|uniref:ATP-dependent RNA helicase vasa-like n=1 Tax=Choristoneura fumiferana TaxID=7141 RepID=UPI003D15BDFC
MSHCKITSRLCGDMEAAALVTASNEALPKDVEQIFQQVSKYDKMKAITKLLGENDGKSVLVFVKTKRNADFIAVMLSEQQKLTSSIHGDRLQRDREQARQNFMSGHHKILVATSAAVCGPDIKHVDMVVNYDLPASVGEYLHRIGRTGCVGHRGKAVSFFDVDHDAGLVADLARVLRQADQPLPDFFPVGGVATCQVNDAMAVTSETSTAHQLQCPAASCLPRNGARQLVMTPHGPLIYWCCFRSECSYYGACDYNT